MLQHIFCNYTHTRITSAAIYSEAIQLQEYPIPLPWASVCHKNHQVPISRKTASGIIDPVVSKRPETNSEYKKGLFAENLYLIVVFPFGVNENPHIFSSASPTTSQRQSVHS